MATQQFIDESGATQVAALGSAGSMEFGAGTPSSTAGQITVDGVNLNNGSLLAAGTVPPSGNTRTTGSASLSGSGASVTVSTSKSQVPQVSIDNSSGNVFVFSITTTSFGLLDVASPGGGSLSIPYSFL